MVGKAQRDVASADKHACLDVVASSTLGDVGAGDEGDATVNDDGFGVQRSSRCGALIGWPAQPGYWQAIQGLGRCAREVRVVEGIFCENCHADPADDCGCQCGSQLVMHVEGVGDDQDLLCSFINQLEQNLFSSACVDGLACRPADDELKMGVTARILMGMRGRGDGGAHGDTCWPCMLGPCVQQPLCTLPEGCRRDEAGDVLRNGRSFQRRQSGGEPFSVGRLQGPSNTRSCLQELPGRYFARHGVRQSQR